MVADPRTKPHNPYEDDADDLEGDVHEEVPYETERFLRPCGHAPEWMHSADSPRQQRRERNQFWSNVL